MKSVFHTGITVSNLDASVAFYRDVLGFELVTGPTDVFEGEELSTGVGVPGASLRLALLRVGNSSLELHQYVTPKSPVNKPMPPNTLGFMHVAFSVENIEEKVKALKTKGVKFLSEINVVKKGPLAGWKWVYFKDPDDITLEMVELL